MKLAYYFRSFGRLFWGEQPPFASFGRGGRYFFALKHDEQPTPRRKSPWPVALTLMVLGALALIAFLFLRIESWPMRTARQGTAELERLAGKVRDAFVEMAQLQPRVTVKDRVIMEQTTGVAELALVSRKMSVEHEFSHTWAGSTKRVKLQAAFTAKAGFDLHENVAVDVRDDAIQCRCHVRRFWESSRKRWTCSNLRTATGTASPPTILRRSSLPCRVSRVRERSKQG